MQLRPPPPPTTTHHPHHPHPFFPASAVDYVAMTPEGRVFDSSLEKGYPYQIRVGAGQASGGVGWGWKGGEGDGADAAGTCRCRMRARLAGPRPCFGCPSETFKFCCIACNTHRPACSVGALVGSAAVARQGRPHGQSPSARHAAPRASFSPL